MEEFVYLSPEWTEEGRRRVEAELSPEMLHHVTSSMTNLYKNCPDGRDRYFHVAFEDGRLAAFETGEGEGPRAEFRIIADYSTFAQITRGELGAVKALTSRKLALRGNMAKALRLAPLVDKLNRVLATIPTRF
ncbi:MAG: SCP2 sterol-binding domain-containing protein [Actinobacteria bacterium]|nr:SCP2 sterol-binding domain-containing protein [Actinomycetota bacterium]MDI6831439.1 SCP2 sterol-binding domain-containing protein [Actinomycetota bacterium]